MYEPIEDTILVDTDRFRLIEVVSNLLSNAVNSPRETVGLYISIRKRN